MCHVADRVHLISNHCSGDDITLIGSLIWDFSWYIVSWVFLSWFSCTDFPNWKEQFLPAQEGKFLLLLVQEFCSLHTRALSASAPVRLFIPASSHHWLYFVSQKEPICSSRPTSVTAQNSIPQLILHIQWSVSNQSWFRDALHEGFTNDPCHPALLYVLLSCLICLALISS